MSKREEAVTVAQSGVRGSVVDHEPTERGAPREPLEVGQQIGRYVVVGALGTGGMGVVFRAFDPELDRVIALKMMRPGRDTEDDRLRLMREAQAMARLAHPNVIAVYDVGVHQRQVFVAMELVDGLDLGRWLDVGRAWREVVDIFVGAGRGLAAAHRVGLVHRDFKPSNVLIDGNDRARVLDFGLARAAESGIEHPDVSAELRSGELLSSELTQTNLAIGTLPYMAPEQHRGIVDQAVDQFAFCVALYQALFRTRPYPAREPPELLRQKLQGPADPPRAAAVPGWLAAIVLRGLSPKPADRFPTMEALLQKLETVPRRRRQRRNAVLLVGSFVGVGGLVYTLDHDGGSPCAGAGGHLVGIWDGARRQAVGAAIRATQTAYAEGAAAFVEKQLDAYAGEWTTMHADACEATHVRHEQSSDLLDLRMRCLQRRLDGLVATVTVLEGANAAVVEQSNRSVTGLAPIAACGDVEALTQVVPPPDQQVAESVDDTHKQLVSLEARARAGRLEGLRAEAAEILGVAEAVGYAPLVAEAHLRVAEVARQTADHDGAIVHATEAYFAAQASRAAPIAALAAAHLGYSYGAKKNDSESARSWVRHGRGELARLGHELPAVAGAFETDLGAAAAAEGRFVVGLDHYRRAHALMSRANGPDHVNVGRASLNIGNMLTNLARWDEAEKAYGRALEIYRSQLGGRHPLVGRVFGNLTELEYHRGQPKRALEFGEQSLEILESAYGPDHPDVAIALNLLGTSLLEVERLDAALAVYRRARSIFEAAHGPDHPYVAMQDLNIGLMHTGLGDHEQALRVLAVARPVLEGKLPSDHPHILGLHTIVGQALLGAERYAEAGREHRQALQVAETLYGASHPKVASTLHDLGLALFGTGHPRAALRHLVRSELMRERTAGSNHPQLGGTLLEKARTQLVLGHDEGARATLDRLRTMSGRVELPSDVVAGLDELTAKLPEP